jgi:hypothetical protein
MSQNYLVLVFFTFCYIIIDVGLQMVNAEVMLHMRQQREKMRRSKNRQRAADNTLEKTVYSNVASKCLFVLSVFSGRLCVLAGSWTGPTGDRQPEQPSEDCAGRQALRRQPHDGLGLAVQRRTQALWNQQNDRGFRQRALNNNCIN